MFLYWIYCILLSPFLLEYLPFMVSNWGQRCLNLGNFSLREFSLIVINFSSDNANFILISQWSDLNKQTIETSAFWLFYILLIFMLWYSSFTRHKKKRKKEREKRQVTPFFGFTNQNVLISSLSSFCCYTSIMPKNITWESGLYSFYWNQWDFYFFFSGF